MQSNVLHPHLIKNALMFMLKSIQAAEFEPLLHFSFFATFVS